METTFLTPVPSFNVGYYSHEEAQSPYPVSHTYLQPMPEFTYGTHTTSPQTEPQILIDVPSFKSFSGLIIIIIFLQLVISLFICLGRTDFNFVLYLLGYYIFCIDCEKSSETNDILGLRTGDESELPKGFYLYVASRKMEKSVYYYTLLLAVASLIDFSWVFIAKSSWTCSNSDPSVCFGKDDIRMRSVYGIHQFTMIGSWTNLFLKVVLIILAQVWLRARPRPVKN
eukprot:GHVP01031248.1.p1 GENE.GHVP01031248.1~~GHVP01031248.1.p1  ORF type:complete len:227 (+),score=22.61 GHVP01031248.1:405-1085(+)